MPCRDRAGTDGVKADVMSRNGILQLPETKINREDLVNTWSVCPHLSDPNSLFGYYAGSGSIMLLLGKCLCHECYESILARRDLTEFIDSCDHLTDRGFQQGFVQPLFQVNKAVFRARNNLFGSETSCWTWIGCPHVSRPDDLLQLYANCNPIFFHEGFITCNDCLDIVPSAGMYLKILLGCEAMTDAELQERVFKNLYSINRNIVTAVRCYSQ
jgi:hypothetical protein